MTQVVNKTEGPFPRPFWVFNSAATLPQKFATLDAANEWAETRAKDLVNSMDLWVVEVKTYVEAIRPDPD